MPSSSTQTDSVVVKNLRWASRRFKSGRVINYALKNYVLVGGTERIGQICSLFLYAGINYVLVNLLASPPHFHYGMRQYKKWLDNQVATIEPTTVLSRPLPVALSQDDLWTVF